MSAFVPAPELLEDRLAVDWAVSQLELARRLGLAERVEALAAAFSDDVVRRRAQCSCASGIDILHAAIPARGVDVIRGRLRQQAVPLFALPQRLLRLLALGDVPVYPGKPDGPVMIIPLNLAAARDPADATVLTAHAVFDFMHVGPTFPMIS